MEKNYIDLIRKNKLSYSSLDSLTKELNKLTAEATVDIKNQLLTLINNGDLFLDKNNKVSISQDRGYLKAIISVNKKGFGFAKVENYPDFFIPAFAINGALDGDLCLVEITNTKSDEDIEARVVKVLTRNTTHVVGTYIVGKSKNVVFPDDPRLPQIRILKGNALNAQNNQKVWVELDVDSITKNLAHGKIVEILGKANQPKAEQLSIIRSFNLVDKFDAKTLNEAKSISQVVNLKDFKNRTDFTKHKVITIDGEDARDFDDALSVEKLPNGYRLFVHIADVSNYVVENSALDKSAYERGTSVYFSNQVIPMLPKELSNGICSLNEGVNRLTLSVEILLDDDARVVSSKVQEGVICSSHRMTYTEITNILAGDQLLIEKYADVYNDILAYQEISQKLKKLREVRGEIRFNLPEPYILENDAGEIVSIEKRVQDESHEIIESLMVLANECVAKTYFDKKLPFIYRVHEKPDADKLARITNILNGMGVSNNLDEDGDKPMAFQLITKKIAGLPGEATMMKLMLRSMMKARYCPQCLGHFGLASEYYCHFTSPIRRYPDLMIHRIIKQYINGVPLDELKRKYVPIVERASEQSSLTEKNADEAEREVDDYKKALYMQKFLGEKFVGTISGVQEFGIFVELDNGVEGLVRAEDLPMDSYEYDDMSLSLNGQTHTYKIGDKIEILVANSNTQLRQVDFVLADDSIKLGAFVVNKNAKKADKQNFKRTARGKNKSSTKKYGKTSRKSGKSKR